ncbi:MAG: imidazoleglycerol-phosphate dehydratase [Candidatus Omnitrophica bacterium]|nr:imidazoleglycerol-phosphate dehydratase [Candidatus Omnitrophota bacterium]
MKARTAAARRDTREARIRVKVKLDGSGRADVRTGIRFLDHMLELLAKHGLFDLEVKARGDLDVDSHHTNEDLGLVLGEAFHAALGQKRGIRRMGSAFVPMDETLARVRAVVDLSGRPHLSWSWRASARQPAGSAYGVVDARHFLEAFVTRSAVTLHVDVLKAGGDTHHLLESVFKALGRALREAVERDPRVRGVPSTKGRLS